MGGGVGVWFEWGWRSEGCVVRFFEGLLFYFSNLFNLFVA